MEIIKPSKSILIYDARGNQKAYVIEDLMGSKMIGRMPKHFKLIGVFQGFKLKRIKELFEPSSVIFFSRLDQIPKNYRVELFNHVDLITIAK